MNDKKIIECYQKRDETAISMTIEHYGKYCYLIAYNILGSREDAEEAVDDALVDIWNAIPPALPTSLKAYVARAVRNSAISIYRRNHAKKRNGEAEVLLSELEECIPDPAGEADADSISLDSAISSFLAELSEDKRRIFVKRYFFGEELDKLASSEGISEKRLSVILFRLRAKLKKHLEKEELFI